MHFVFDFINKDLSLFKDVIHAVNLYYELKDVFGGINISAIPSLTTPGVTTTPMATSVTPQSSLIDIETVRRHIAIYGAVYLYAKFKEFKNRIFFLNSENIIFRYSL